MLAFFFITVFHSRIICGSIKDFTIDNPSGVNLVESHMLCFV